MNKLTEQLGRSKLLKRTKRIQLSNPLQRFFDEVGNITLFSLRIVKEVFLPPYEPREVLKQCYEIGYKSIALVGITGFIMGLVLTIQSRPTLEEFGAESWLPAMVAVSIVREIGP